MTINKKVTGTAVSVPAGLAWGALVSVTVTLTGAAIAAKLIDREVLTWSQSGYAVLMILLLSAWMGATVSAGKIKRRRIAVCLGSGMMYMLILMCITALFFGGRYSGVGETALLILCGSGLAVFTGTTSKRKGRAIKAKRHTVKLNKIS